MSIQNEVRLLGNITLDHIYHLAQWPAQGTSNRFESHKTSIGGIGNMISPLKEHQINVFIEGAVGQDEGGKLINDYLNHQAVNYLLHQTGLPTSHALILSNLQDRERTSFVQWGCGLSRFIPSSTNCQWSHVAYLDISPINLKIVKRNSKIVSADLCLSNPSSETIQRIIGQLHYLDYLFISASEMPPYVSKIEETPTFLKEVSLKHLILHTREKTFIVDRQRYVEVKNDQPVIDNVDVLGAGDIYCANFMAHQLKYGGNLPESALYAHQQTTKFILMKNEKV